MRERTIYICEKCGAEFELKDWAEECEAHHKWPTIIGCKYTRDENCLGGKGYEFPSVITVKFEGHDGEEYSYVK